MKRSLGLLSFVVAAFVITGCASLPPCLFGGSTPAEETVCAAHNFGVEGSELLLRAENANALEYDGGNCWTHFQAVSKRLLPYGYTIEKLTRPGHISALVTDPVTGAQFVVDNGFLIPIDTYGGVATLAEFNADWRQRQ